jgi:hypothetical protein
LLVRDGEKSFCVLRRSDVAFWHIAAFAAPQMFVGYWGNNGQKSAQSLSG